MVLLMMLIMNVINFCTTVMFVRRHVVDDDDNLSNIIDDNDVDGLTCFAETMIMVNRNVVIIIDNNKITAAFIITIVIIRDVSFAWFLFFIFVYVIVLFCFLFVCLFVCLFVFGNPYQKTFLYFPKERNKESLIRRRGRKMALFPPYFCYWFNAS